MRIKQVYSGLLTPYLEFSYLASPGKRPDSDHQDHILGVSQATVLAVGKQHVQFQVMHSSRSDPRGEV